MRTTQGIRLGGNRAFINLYVNGKSATRVKGVSNLRYVAKNCRAQRGSGVRPPILMVYRTFSTSQDERAPRHEGEQLHG